MLDLSRSVEKRKGMRCACTAARDRASAALREPVLLCCTGCVACILRLATLRSSLLSARARVHRAREPIRGLLPSPERLAQDRYLLESIAEEYSIGHASTTCFHWHVELAARSWISSLDVSSNILSGEWFTAQWDSNLDVPWYFKET